MTISQTRILSLSMKKQIIALFILISNLSIGQVFHFVDTTTTLIKSTDQSPAHWYIEIFNDAAVDTNLRWKASFSNIPSAWQIDFDDQTNYSTDVQHGDSSDFVLQTGLSFPQKLIIGAILNNTPGVGSVYFDIYDPYNSSVTHRIEFHFVVTQATASLIEVKNEDWLKQNGNLFSFDEKYIGRNLRIYSSAGQLLFHDKIEPTMHFSDLPKGVVYFVAEEENGYASKKIML